MTTIAKSGARLDAVDLAIMWDRLIALTDEIVSALT